MWQQWYILVMYVFSLVLNLIMFGKSKKPQPLINVGFMLFGFYVLYSGGFFKGLFY